MSRFKTFSALFFSLVVLAMMVPQVRASLVFTDKSVNLGGTGFVKTDECGYLYGVSSDVSESVGTHLYVTRAEFPHEQACVTREGYFYRNDGGLTEDARESYADLIITEGDKRLLMNFAWDDSASSKYAVNVDMTTGEWSGYAVLQVKPKPTGYYDGELIPGKQWVWFDWTCADLSGSGRAACTEEEASKYRVKTDLITGEVSGYAWNDQYGFIPFGGGYLGDEFVGISMELQPHKVVALVDVLAGKTNLGVNAVDLSTAPLADGYDYWRVRVQFWDDLAGRFLTEEDLEEGSFEVSPVDAGIAEMFLNQVENVGDPIRISKANKDFGCDVPDAAYCSVPAVYDAEGDLVTPWSANAFIYSGAPTSDMLGVNTDTDEEVNHFSDRDGCRWIYEEQGFGAVPPGDCPDRSFFEPLKEDVFYARTGDRNMIGINGVVLGMPAFTEAVYTFDDSDPSIREIPVGGDTKLLYLPDFNDDGDGDGTNDALYMSFRPRFLAEKFVALYDGEEYTHIADTEPGLVMSLHSKATISEVSQAAKAHLVTPRPDLEVHYQLDVDHRDETGGVIVPSKNSNFLLLDTISGGSVDCPTRVEMVTDDRSSYDYQAPMGYGQKTATTCAAEVPSEPAPTEEKLLNPTAEQWVCDSVTEALYQGEPSCYFTAYMDIVDRHAEEAEPVKVLGAINSLLNDEAVFDNSEEVSILGSTDSIALRNKMYAQVVRYSLGQDTASSGTLDEKMNPSAGLLTLMDGRLIVARGDVTIEGMPSAGTGFSDKTLVVIGGNVYIERNIYGGRLGIIAFKDGGWGGNVYIAPAVSDLHANFFLDGALYSYDGSARFEEDDGFAYAHVPTWRNEETRLSALKNQLYINGSISSHNTVNGATVEECDGVCVPSFSVGDGTVVDASGTVDYDPGEGVLTGYEIAREHDLMLLRQYRLCYPLGDDGRPDYDAEPDQVCGDDGAQLSAYGSAENLYNSVILEYATADRLPIFRSQDGLFN